MTPGGWWCATASSARPGNWPCTPRPSTRCAATSGSATELPRPPGQRRCWCPRPGPGCSTATSTTRSIAWSAWPGSRPRSGSCRPRIHDLRHSFAVAAMLDAYAAGQDGQTRLTLLSTWLGHVHPGSTYWYLSASPELMAVAGQRLETHLAAHLGSRVGRSVMTALAPTLQAFFTERLIRQRHASAHTVAAYRDTMRLLLGYAAELTGRAPSALDIADLDAPLIGGFLDHLEHRARQQRPDPQRPPGRDPLPVPVRRPRSSRTRRQHRPGPGDPAQTLRPGVDQLPDRARGRRAARLLRPDDLDRAPRPRAAAARRPDRATDLRTDRAHPRRRAPRLGRARRLPRQRPQGPDHPAHQRHGHRPARLARRTPPRPRRAAVPDPSRHHAQPRRHRTSPRPLHRPSREPLPVAARKEDQRARPAAHHRDAVAARRGRHQRHRPLARSRQRRDDADLPARRPHS